MSYYRSLKTTQHNATCSLILTTVFYLQQRLHLLHPKQLALLQLRARLAERLGQHTLLTRHTGHELAHLAVKELQLVLAVQQLALALPQPEELLAVRHGRVGLREDLAAMRVRLVRGQLKALVLQLCQIQKSV